MYLITVHQVPGEWRDRQFPIEHPSGCHLHSFAYAPPERVVCVWERDVYGTAMTEEEVEWGDSASVGAEAV